MERRENLGRGNVAVADMKARIAALQELGEDVFTALWDRNHRAVSGEGFTYEYARAEEVRSSR